MVAEPGRTRADRDRENPGPKDLRGDPPAHRADSLARPCTHVRLWNTESGEPTGTLPLRVRVPFALDPAGRFAALGERDDGIWLEGLGGGGGPLLLRGVGLHDGYAYDPSAEAIQYFGEAGRGVGACAFGTLRVPLEVCVERFEDPTLFSRWRARIDSPHHAE